MRDAYLKWANDWGYEMKTSTPLCITNFEISCKNNTFDLQNSQTNTGEKNSKF